MDVMKYEVGTLFYFEGCLLLPLQRFNALQKTSTWWKHNVWDLEAKYVPSNLGIITAVINDFKINNDGFYNILVDGQQYVVSKAWMDVNCDRRGIPTPSVPSTAEKRTKRNRAALRAVKNNKRIKCNRQ